MKYQNHFGPIKGLHHVTTRMHHITVHIHVNHYKLQVFNFNLRGRSALCCKYRIFSSGVTEPNFLGTKKIKWSSVFFYKKPALKIRNIDFVLKAFPNFQL